MSTSVDTGREKVKSYNFFNGIKTYKIQWISKASAAQCAGRAGRTGPGCKWRQPEATALLEAECSLKALEALDSNGKLTSFGKAMAHYPMSSAIRGCS